MAEKKTKPRGLGRGLSALMADVSPTPVEASGGESRTDQSVPIESLKPNPDQPRRDFSEKDLADLAASIREKGIIQPLIVRRATDETYEIVAGERRWRAAQIASLHDVPVIIRDLDDVEVLEIAIIENIQRSDLNAIEEAAAYRQLMDRFGHTQEQLAEALGKSRSHIANLIRLLGLPEDVQSMLRHGKLTAGHARALITAPNPSELALQVVNKGLSVRDTEKLVRKNSAPKIPRAAGQQRMSAGEKDADTRALEGDLAANLRMKVDIYHEPGGDRGKLTLHYNSLDQLDTLCRLLSGQ